jgi:hypothetical protein
MSAEFKCGVGELLTSTWEIDAREIVESLALGAASYPTTLAPFNFVQSEVKVGATVGAAAHVEGVRPARSRSTARRRRTATTPATAARSPSRHQRLPGDHRVVRRRLHHQGRLRRPVPRRHAVRPGVGVHRPGARLRVRDVPDHAAGLRVHRRHAVSRRARGHRGSFPFETFFDGTNQAKIEYISDRHDALMVEVTVGARPRLARTRRRGPIDNARASAPPPCGHPCGREADHRGHPQGGQGDTPQAGWAGRHHGRRQARS